MSPPQRLRDLDTEAFTARYGCDRFVATVLGNRLEYVLEHVCQKLLACAFSPVLRDLYDFAATLTGPPETGYATPVVSKSFMAFTGTMPLVFASNIMVDPATMPGWLRLFVQLNPVSSMTTAMRGLMGGGLTLSQVGYALLAPALLTLVLAPLTVRLYRRR